MNDKTEKQLSELEDEIGRLFNNADLSIEEGARVLSKLLMNVAEETGMRCIALVDNDTGTMSTIDFKVDINKKQTKSQNSCTKH